MSAITKIFTVLNLIFSVAITFFALAYFSHAVNYRKQAEELDTSLKTVQTQLKDKGAEFDTFKTVANAEKTGLQGKLDVKIGELSAKQNDCDSLSAQLRKAQDDVVRANRQVDGINEQILALNSERKLMQVDLDQRKNELFDLRERERRAVDAASDLGAQTETLQAQLAAKESRLHTCMEELGSAELQLAELKKRLPPGAGDVVVGGAVKPINATVMAVAEKDGVVILNVGSNYEVKPGYEFILYRENSYVCKVKVTDVNHEWSGAELVRDSVKLKVQAGDQATTSLSQ